MVLEGKATVWQPLPLTLAVLYGRWVLVYSVHGPQLHSSKFVILIVVYKLEFTTLCRFSPQFYITKENRGNEGTCVGVSRWPVRDHNHHTTTDMWLYRAYSGNLYHGGELVRTLPSFTQGDTITCILDMEAHTVSFAKNDKVWSNIYCQYSSDWVLCSCLIFVCLFSFSFRSQSWHLKVWSLMNYILVCYSTAVTLERRYSVYCTDLLDLLFIWIRFIISMGNVIYLETQAATHTGFALTSYYWIIAALGYTWKKLVLFHILHNMFQKYFVLQNPPNTWNSVLVTGGSEWSPDERHAQQSASWRPSLQPPGYCATRVNSASAASAPPVWPVVPAHKPVYSYPPGAHWSPAERG